MDVFCTALHHFIESRALRGWKWL